MFSAATGADEAAGAVDGRASEVGQLSVIVPVQQDVMGPDVDLEDAARVQVLQAEGDLGGPAEDVWFWRDAAGVAEVPEAFAEGELEALEDDLVPVGAEQLGDVRMGAEALVDGVLDNELFVAVGQAARRLDHGRGRQLVDETGDAA